MSDVSVWRSFLWINNTSSANARGRKDNVILVFYVCYYFIKEGRKVGYLLAFIMKCYNKFRFWFHQKYTTKLLLVPPISAVPAKIRHLVL